MKRKTLLKIAGAALGATLALSGISVHAQQYPTKPVRVVVPFATGATDAMTRIVAEKLTAALGQPFIVDNKPGAGGMLGADIVAKAAPDGYTILMTVDGVLTQLPFASTRMPFKADKDLVPVSMISTTSTVLIVHSGFPAKTFPELMAFAKANPDKLNFGSAVVYNQIKAEEFKEIGLTNKLIPYKGGGPMQAAIMGGEIDVAVMDLGSVLGAGNRVRPLMVLSPNRQPKLPDVPTARELGYQRVEGDIWYGLFAPAGTPEAIRSRLSSELVKILAMPDVREKAAGIGMETKHSTPAQLAEIMKEDSLRWGKIIQAAGIRVD